MYVFSVQRNFYKGQILYTDNFYMSYENPRRNNKKIPTERYPPLQTKKKKDDIKRRSPYGKIIPEKELEMHANNVIQVKVVK